MALNTQNKPGAYYKRVSHSFKIAVVILLFILTAIRLALVFYFPATDIISDKVFLSVVLFIVFYLWIQEFLDFHQLMVMNRDLQEAHEQLKAAEIDTIASLIKTEEAKDVYTSGHSERVTRIALALAEEMNLNE